MKFEREIPIGLDARRKKPQGGGLNQPPPPPMGLGLSVNHYFHLTLPGRQVSNIFVSKQPVDRWL